MYSWSRYFALSRWILPVAYLLVLILVSPPQPLLAQQTLTYEAYLALIGQLREQVREVQGQSAAACTITLNETASTLAEITTVVMPDSSPMNVNHAGVLEVLRQQPCDAVRAANYLAGICPVQLCVAPVSDSLAPSESDDDNPPPLLSDLPTPPPDSIPPDNSTPLDESPLSGQPSLSGEPPLDDNLPPDVAEGTEAADSNPNNSGQPLENESGNNEEADSGEAPAPPEEMAANGPGDTPDSNAEINGGEGDTEQPLPADDPGDEPEESAATATPSNASPQAEAEPTEMANTGQALLDLARENQFLLWVALAAALVLGIGLIILFWSRQRLPQLDEDGGEAEAEEQEEKPQVKTIIDEGRQRVADKDCRMAIRHLFLALLLRLDEQNILIYDKAMTNYELLEATGERRHLHTDLAPIITIFERVWYGFEPLTADEYDTLAGQIELVTGSQR